MLRYIEVKVARDPTAAVIHRAVAEWELPVLEEVFGEGNVQRVGEKLHQAPAPAPAAEYQRLVDAYKQPPGESSVPYAETVYGSGERGRRQLAKAIQEAIVEIVPEADPLVA